MNNYEQNNGNDSQFNNYSQPYTVAEGVTVISKKSKLPFILGGVGIILAVAVAICLVVPSVNNSVRMALMSPEKYLAHIEKKNFDTYADAIGVDYQSYLDAVNAEDEELNLGASFDVSLEPGSGLKDFLSDELQGMIDFESAGAAFSFNAKGDNASVNADIKINNKLLAQAEFLADVEKTYIRIPQLSAAYLYFAIDDEESDDYEDKFNKVMEVLDKNPLTADELETIITKYSSLIFENIDDVKTEKGIKGNVNGVNYDYNKLIVKIDNENARKIATNVLNALKEDEAIKNFFVKTELFTDSEYDEKISEALKDVEKGNKQNGSIDIEIYVDNVGKVMGRSVTFTEEGKKSKSLLSYITAENGNNFAADVELKNDDFTNKIKITPTGEKHVYSGEISFLDTSSYEPSDMTITFENLKAVNEEKGYISGKFSIKGQAISGNMKDAPDGINIDEIEMVFESDGESQKLKGTFGTALVLNATYKYGEADEIKFPSSSDEMYDGDDPEEYAKYEASLGYDALIDNLSDCFGMEREELESLIYMMIYGYDPYAYDGYGYDYDNDYYYDHNEFY